MKMFLVLLGLFLVTTLAPVGILASHVVVWRSHWSVRAVVVLAVLAPLLWVGAFEPFVILALEAAMVALLLTIRDRRLAAGAVPPPRPPFWRQLVPVKFSLATLLQVTTLSAAGLAVILRMPRHDRSTWGSIIAIGMGSAACVAIGRVGALGAVRWWIRWPLLAATNVAIALALCLSDSFVPAIGDYFVGAAGLAALSAGRKFSAGALWFAVCPAVSLAVAQWFVTYSWGNLAVSRMIRGILCFSVLLPAYAWWGLLIREPIPERQPLAENAYERIVESAQRMPALKIINRLYDPDAPEIDERVASVLDASSDELLKLRPALRLPSDVMVDYASRETFFDRLQQIQDSRSLVRVLVGNGRLALQRGDPSEACANFLDAIHVGFAVRARGLLIDCMVGVACSGIGIHRLAEQREQLTPEDRRQAIVELLALAEAAEPYESFQRRDRIWEEHTSDWLAKLHGRLTELSQWRSEKNASEEQQEFNPALGMPSLKRENAELRLLAVDLALRSYFTENGEYPESLEALVPNYLDRVPADPFAPHGEPLRYARTGLQFVLYSVDANHVDDGGNVTTETEDERLLRESALDFSLDGMLLISRQRRIPSPQTPIDDSSSTSAR